MDSGLEYLIKSIDHIKVLHNLFINEENFNFPEEQNDFDIYQENLTSLNEAFNKIKVYEQLYNQQNRQMILADIIEYILLGRGFYAIGSKKSDNNSKQLFIKGVLHFVNLLMSYESITINTNRRNLYLNQLIEKIPEIENEDYFQELLEFEDSIGLPASQASKSLSKYFDRLLPKTAGGLWHELLVYIFMLRNDLGFILPLLLHQRIYSLNDHLIPPDFLILTADKRIYGIEVGIKKEIQSGSFSLKTAAPTATIDTINSRNSDRCPSCKKWIGICPFVIDNYSNTKFEIKSIKVNCLSDCTLFSKEEIAYGICKYSKYARNRTRTLIHTHHEFSDNKHYHYQCVLNNVEKNKKIEIIEAEDATAIKTHFPYYSGLEELI